MRGLRGIAEEVLLDRAGQDPWKAERESRMEINGMTYTAGGDGTITGREIKAMARVPACWVVNRLMPGPGADPEVADDERVPTIGRYRVRDPSTSAA